MACPCADSTESSILEPVCKEYNDYEAQLELLPCPLHPAINESLHPCFEFASDSELAKLAEGMTPKNTEKEYQMGFRQFLSVENSKKYEISL